MRRHTWFAAMFLLLASACPAQDMRSGDGGAGRRHAEPGPVSADDAVCQAFTSPPAEPPCGQPEFARREHRVLKALLEQPEFSVRETSWEIRRRKPEAPPHPVTPDPFWLRWLGWMRALSAWLSSLGSVLLWLLAALLLILLLWKRALWLPYLQDRRRAAPAAVPSQAVLAVQSAQALPADLEGSARAAWAVGQHAEALSLLFRDALRLLSQRHAVRIPEGATEGEALRLLDRHAADLRPELVRLTHAWMALAYAHRLPGDFEGLLDCHRRIAAGAA